MQKRKVLIVDDDSDSLMMLAAVFEREDAEVTALENAFAAYNLVVSQSSCGQSFDMVVIDIRMPGMNGNELAKQLREAGHDGPIIAWTITTTEEGRRTSAEAGVTSYLSKQTLNRDLVKALLDEHC